MYNPKLYPEPLAHGKVKRSTRNPKYGEYGQKLPSSSRRKSKSQGDDGPAKKKARRTIPEVEKGICAVWDCLATHPAGRDLKRGSCNRFRRAGTKAKPLFTEMANGEFFKDEDNETLICNQCWQNGNHSFYLVNVDNRQRIESRTPRGKPSKSGLQQQNQKSKRKRATSTRPRQQIPCYQSTAPSVDLDFEKHSYEPTHCLTTNSFDSCSLYDDSPFSADYSLSELNGSRLIDLNSNNLSLTGFCDQEEIGPLGYPFGSPPNFGSPLMQLSYCPSSPPQDTRALIAETVAVEAKRAMEAMCSANTFFDSGFDQSTTSAFSFSSSSSSSSSNEENSDFTEQVDINILSQMFTSFMQKHHSFVHNSIFGGCFAEEVPTQAIKKLKDSVSQKVISALEYLEDVCEQTLQLGAVLEKHNTSVSQSLLEMNVLTTVFIELLKEHSTVP